MNFRKITEEPSLYDDLEHKSTRELLEDINREDHRVADAVHDALPQIAALIDDLVPRLRQGGRVFYIGAGTSGRLGVLDASELPPTYGVAPTLFTGIIAGGDRALRAAVEHAEDDAQQGWRDLVDAGVMEQPTQNGGVGENSFADPVETERLSVTSVIGLSASGTAPYVVGALREARRHGILTAAITCNPGAPLTEVADHSIVTVVGPEVVTGSSRMKAGTAQKLVLNMVSTATMVRLGHVRGNRMVDMQLTNQKLVDRGTRMLVDLLHVSYDEARSLLLHYGSVEKSLAGERGAILSPPLSPHQTPT